MPNSLLTASLVTQSGPESQLIWGLQRQIVDADYLASKQGRRSVCAANVINPNTKTKSRNRFDAGSLKMLFVSQNNHQTNDTLFLYVESV